MTKKWGLSVSIPSNLAEINRNEERLKLVLFSKHVWDQLFTVDTIWNIGETGDIYRQSPVKSPDIKTL